MKFLYNTVIGRLILKLLLHTRILNFSVRWLHSRDSKWLIEPYISKHKIDMAPFRGQEYENFAEFFARRKNERSFATDPRVLISPCDGMLSMVSIGRNKKFYIKNSWYSVYDLVPDRTLANYYKNGLCMIVRLRGCDYHHFCYIDDCYHGKGHLIPGTLHSVQPIALENTPVFKMNKRMWSIMDTAGFGLVAQIEIGAVFVGGIVHEREKARAKRGDEMGHFELCGSTIVLLFSSVVKENLRLLGNIEDKVIPFGEYEVKMGGAVGYVKMPHSNSPY